MYFPRLYEKLCNTISVYQIKKENLLMTVMARQFIEQSQSKDNSRTSPKGERLRRIQHLANLSREEIWVVRLCKFPWHTLTTKTIYPKKPTI
jgi:hypothetical protein